MASDFTSKLLNWYKRNARELPWRDHPDPYAVWVSEVMLQQTRVETVVPYFRQWMARFPTIVDLAAASQQEVLSLWEGLGYYSRARNLHRAAQIVAQEHNGVLPQDVRTLKELPGIGAYTAAAIVSMAFGGDHPALDGNIRRVLCRVFNISEPLRSAAGEHRLAELLWEHLPPGKAGDYNQAMMDLGATVCTPKSPGCERCPLACLCRARQRGLQEERPVRGRKAKLPHYTVTAAVIQRGNEVLIVQRPPRGLLGGMWEFPGGKQEPGESLPACLRREIREELKADVQVGDRLGVFTHAYSHFKITLHAYLCTYHGHPPQLVEHTDLRWVQPLDLDAFPMGKIDRQISKRLQRLGISNPT